MPHPEKSISVETQERPASRFTHVQYAWDDELAGRLTPLEALVYRSNTLGGDQRITITGGGSTSVKVMEWDPASGEFVEVIWVKGSGQDLRASKETHFLPLYQDKLVALRDAYGNDRLPAEAKHSVTERIKAAAFRRSECAPSTDTALHAFMPYAHVSHTHPQAALAIGASENARSLTRQIWGDRMIWLPRQRPGFELGLQLQDAWHRHPNARGALIAGNGVATWSDDNKTCYQQTLELIEQAARHIEAHDRGDMTFGGPRYRALSASDRQTVLAHLLLFLRTLVSEEDERVATVEAGPAMQRFVNSVDAPRLVNQGVACAYHLRHTKLKPLYIDWDPVNETVDDLHHRLRQGVERYKQAYRAYYDTLKNDRSPAMHSPAPSVCLIPGIGMITWGRTELESRIISEAYRSAVDVMRGAEAIDAYVGLTERDAFDIEYG